MRIILLLLILVQPWLVLGQEGVLLYVGSTEDSGWQIFELRLSSGAVSQLSFSMGDKREPQHSAAAKLTTCRNSLGQVLKLNDGKEQVLITNIQHCANYALVPDGTAFYFTKPGEGIRRQDIWIQEITETEPRLAASVPEGMLKQQRIFGGLTRKGSLFSPRPTPARQNTPPPKRVWTLSRIGLPTPNPFFSLSKTHAGTTSSSSIPSKTRPSPRCFRQSG